MFLPLRYYYQDFVNLSNDEIVLLMESKEWVEPEVFTEYVHQRMVSKKTLIVPRLRGDGHFSCLRIKIVNETEHSILKRLSAAFEAVEHQGVHYYFGREPQELTDRHSLGIPVSIWGKDPKLTKLQLDYSFANLALAVFGLGFGSRTCSPSHGMNQFCKPEGRGTAATTVSPAQAKEEICQQQYYREAQNSRMLAQPIVRRKLNELVTNVRLFGSTCNNYLMGMVGYICTRQILTTGHVPKSNAPQSLDDGDLRLPGSNRPGYGFVNSTHVDSVDKLSPEQVQDWIAIAEEKKYHYCQELLGRAGTDFCLPTTCAYQIVFKGDAQKDLKVNAYFGMDGLGLSMPIVHGIGHHFLGAMFSHHTCLPLCHRLSDGKISASNHEDNCLIVGWGGTGGSREVAEARARAAAAAAAAAAVSVVEEIEIAQERDLLLLL
jgi:hypothetical protein